MAGTLYMIPISLGEVDTDYYQPQGSIDLIARLDTLLVENARTARQYIRFILPDKDIRSMTIYEVDKHDHYSYPEKAVFEKLQDGTDVGFMSEAGCPGVADPGARVVADCHERGIRVVPLVGPSSLLLGLMASGFSGQRFSFHGYLPYDKDRRRSLLREMAGSTLKRGETHIFIEAPYRNDQLLSELVDLLPPNVRLCLAVDLTTPHEEIYQMTIKDWKKKLAEHPTFHKRPAVFLIGTTTK